MADAAPWWWLTDEELRALGLGSGAERTSTGVLFGAPRSRVRLEVLPRTDEAPLQLGPVSVRVWGGQTSDAAVVGLLHQVARLLHARRGVGFEPDRIRFAPPTETITTPTPTSTLIDVPSVCERACSFCGISRVPISARVPRGSDVSVERAIDEARTPILFTGDDALSHPRIEDWISRAATHGRVGAIGPPRAGRESRRAEALRDAGLATWSSGLFGASARTHDEIAGLAGAFDALSEACVAFRAAGVAVELVVPLVVPLLGELDAITALGATWSGRPVVAQLYVPDPSVGVAFDAMVPQWAALRAALASVSKEHASIEGAPPCVVPAPMRHARASLDRSETSALSYPAPACAACPMREGCPGIAATSLRAVGIAGLGTDS